MDKNARWIVAGILGSLFFLTIIAVIAMVIVFRLTAVPQTPALAQEVVIAAPIPTHEKGKMAVKGEVFSIRAGIASGCTVLLAKPDLQSMVESSISKSRENARAIAALEKKLAELSAASEKEKEARGHAAVYNRVAAEKEDFNARGYNSYQFVHPYTRETHELNWHKDKAKGNAVFDHVMRAAKSKVDALTNEVRAVCRQHSFDPSGLAAEIAAVRVRIAEAPKPASVRQIFTEAQKSPLVLRKSTANSKGEFEFLADSGDYLIVSHYHLGLDKASYLWMVPVHRSAGVEVVNLSQENARIFPKPLP